MTKSKVPGIPRIIHQVWNSSLPLPDFLNEISQKWKLNNPTWNYIFWDKEKIINFMQEKYPLINFALIERMDIFQYFILYHYGGLYVGMDYESIEPLNNIFEDKEFCLLSDPNNVEKICNNFIVSIPCHPFLNFTIEKITSFPYNFYWARDVLSLNDHYCNYPEMGSIYIYSYRIFNPCTKNDIYKYKNGKIEDEIFEDKISEALSICYHLPHHITENLTDVLYLSTGDSQGGAFRAAYRIHSGLCANGIKSKMLVMYSGYSRRKDICIADNTIDEKKDLWEKEVEPLKDYRVSQHISLFSPSVAGINLKKYVDKFNPQILQLHFINAGLIKIEDLLEVNKPIVWRLPDCWAFTGGCHYFEDCERFTQSCGYCPLLNSEMENDLSRIIWTRKSDIFKKINLTIVAPTLWMKEMCLKSSLLKNNHIEVIPNGLSLDNFFPLDKNAARKMLGIPLDKKVILYGADNAVEDPRKGFHLLLRALKRIVGEKQKELILVVFGADKKNLSLALDIPIINLGVIKEHLLLQMAYSQADVMIVPSIQEAFGQTVIEAMACATPVVSFENTGTASIVDHKENGYLAKYKDDRNLLEGILWVLESKSRIKRLSKNAVLKVKKTYDINIVAQQYKLLYEKILSCQN